MFGAQFTRPELSGCGLKSDRLARRSRTYRMHAIGLGIGFLLACLAQTGWLVRSEMGVSSSRIWFVRVPLSKSLEHLKAGMSWLQSRAPKAGINKGRKNKEQELRHPATSGETRVKGHESIKVYYVSSIGNVACCDACSGTGRGCGCGRV